MGVANRQRGSVNLQHGVRSVMRGPKQKSSMGGVLGNNIIFLEQYIFTFWVVRYIFIDILFFNVMPLFF